MRLPLRQRDPQKALQDTYCKLMAARDNPVSFSVPPPGAVLTMFSSPDGFELIADLRAWVCHAMGEKGGFAADYLSDDDLRDFFHYSGETATLMRPDGRQEALCAVMPVSETMMPAEPLPMIATSIGQAWITRIPQCSLVNMKALLPQFVPFHVPFRLDFVLGISALSYRSLLRLAVGDVLVIEHFREEILLGEYCLAKYRHQENDIVIDDIYSDSEENDRAPEVEITEPGPGVSGLNALALRLDFIVHQSTMTLAELMALAPGDTLPVGEGGAHQIAVRANGALVAKGELIWVEERLCVEIQTLYHEA